jgi:hypothetical protein
MKVDIEAELFYLDARGSIEILALGADNYIYKPVNWQACSSPWHEQAIYRLYESNSDKVNEILHQSRIQFKDGTEWHRHGDYNVKNR